LSKRDYARLNIEDFGAHLLRSGDLDPIYIALHRLKANGKEGFADEFQLDRWLVAYWCLYHAGSACFISEFTGRDFWNRLLMAAENVIGPPVGGRWQRGHERRHFRGEAASRAVKKMQGEYPEPEQLVHYLVTGRRKPKGSRDTFTTPIPFGTLAGRAQELPLFGPWISFKICDMTDRVLGHNVDFSTDDVFMFKDPTLAALKLWRLKAGLHEDAKPKDERKAINDVVAYLTSHFSGHTAPPLDDRPVNIQEVETILCKWKSHCNGHYPLNNDIDEINEGVKPWIEHCDTARLFLKEMPKGVR
jgi:hypothetical protein